MTDILFTPTSLGAIKIPNRILMAPMTRSRANEDGTPNELMVEYYRQRASAGLIITEGTQPSENGKGYCRTPGIHSREQIDAWKSVTSAVSDAGGQMVMQIMHVGRVSSGLNKSSNSRTVAPSAIQAKGQMYTDEKGMVDFDVPEELGLAEISDIISEYRQAAANAIEAGFAGVELHGTSGYLPAQFLSTGTNQRKDEYGGSVENRCRFMIEILEAMNQEIGADRVGLRICPGNPFNDLKDADAAETFSTLLNRVNKMNQAYLHVIRMDESITGVDPLELAKTHFSGPLIFNDSYSASEAAEVINAGDAAAISFGRHYVANPRLVEKFAAKDELAKFNPKTLYSPGADGYTSYG